MNVDILYTLFEFDVESRFALILLLFGCSIGVIAILALLIIFIIQIR